MTAKYSPTLATLIYVFSPDRKQVLLIHRNRRQDDEHYGKYNGLGGKLESEEDIVASMARELFEEAGIHATKFSLKGTINWPGFGKNGEDWFGFIFVVTAFSGTPLTGNPEGDLVWKPVEEVMSLPLWEGDRYFLPMIFEASEDSFHGVMPYKEGKPISWKHSRLTH